MKYLITALLGLFFVLPASGQQQPVEWSFFSKKLNNREHEIHLVATIDRGWHIYAQSSSTKGPSPVIIRFSPSPAITFHKGIKEEGELLKKKNIEGVNVRYFENQVIFIQKITITGIAATVKGSVTFVAASGSQILPSQTVDFSIIPAQEIQ